MLGNNGREAGLISLAILSLGLSGCGDAKPAAGGPPPPPEVAVHTIKTEPTTLSVILPGRTSAYRMAEVRPQVSGILTERPFEEGSLVKAGQILFQIDKAPYQAAYDSAVAGVARAESLAVAAANREERYGALVKIKAVGGQDYDDAVAAAKQARAEVGAARAERDRAKVDLERTAISAPIDGRIGRALITVGALVTANQAQELAVIHQLDPIYVDVVQSSTEILRWKRKLERNELQTTGEDELDVTLTLEDGTVYEHKGRLALTEVSVDPLTGSVILRAIFPNPGHFLLPGMFVRAQIIEGVRDNAILVPQQAVTRSPQGDGIAYVVDAENKASERIVVTDRAVGDNWIVAEGLKPGDRVVVEGFQRFRPGDAVTPVQDERVAKSTGATGSIPSGGER